MTNMTEWSDTHNTIIDTTKVTVSSTLLTLRQHVSTLLTLRQHVSSPLQHMSENW